MRFFLYILINSIFLFGCNREERCPDKTLIPLFIYPIKSEYKVGDTVIFVSKFYHTIYDNNGQAFNYNSNIWLNNFAIIPLEPIGSKNTMTSEYIRIINLDEYNLTHYNSDLSDNYDGIFDQKGDSLYFEIRSIWQFPLGPVDIFSLG